MVRVRFAPSPTGSLHLGGALSAVANRTFADEHGGTLLLRIDDTDPARNVAGGAEAILEDLEWLGLHWDEGPVRQSERGARHREARRLVREPDAHRALHLDPARLGRLASEALAALSEEALAERVGVPPAVAPVLRGARDLREAREYAEHVLEPQQVAVDAPETLTRFRELVEGGLEPRAVVRELKAVGGDLKAVRLALTGRERGPELAAVIAALPREGLLRRTSI